MNSSTAVGARFRGLRELSKSTLLEAGGAAEVSCATMSNFERGFGKIADEKIAKLEKFYSQRISERLTAVLKGL